MRALREIPLPHYPVCSNSVCFVSWGTLPRVAPSEIVSAPPELHIIDISPSIRIMSILVTIIDVLVGVVQPHDNRFVGGKLDGARVHAQEPECAFRPARQRICVGGDISKAVPASVAGICSRVPQIEIRRPEVNRASEVVRRQPGGVSGGGDVHPRRPVCRWRRSRRNCGLELGGLVASRQNPVRRREKLVRRIRRVQFMCACEVKLFVNTPVSSGVSVCLPTTPRVAPLEIFPPSPSFRRKCGVPI